MYFEEKRIWAFVLFSTSNLRNIFTYICLYMNSKKMFASIFLGYKRVILSNKGIIRFRRRQVIALNIVFNLPDFQKMSKWSLEKKERFSWLPLRIVDGLMIQGFQWWSRKILRCTKSSFPTSYLLDRAATKDRRRAGYPTSILRHFERVYLYDPVSRIRRYYPGDFYSNLYLSSGLHFTESRKWFRWIPTTQRRTDRTASGLGNCINWSRDWYRKILITRLTAGLV